jgi:CRP/FNR family cyclic AMP-dependent transcriptional regulator
VAHCLAELCNPQLNPTAHRTISISQEEIGRLSGMSRQIANRALHELQDAGLVGVGYGVVDVLDVDALRRFSRSH